MKTNNLVETINAIPAGVFFRMSYTSECPVKAAHKKKGIKVLKLTEATVRTGVAYNSIKAVIDYKATHEPKENATPRANNWEWVSKNRIKHNTNTGKDYMVVATMKSGVNNRSQFIVINNGKASVQSYEDFDRDLLIDSYWTKPEDTLNVVRTIALDNIVNINR